MGGRRQIVGDFWWVWTRRTEGDGQRWKAGSEGKGIDADVDADADAEVQSFLVNSANLRT